MATIRKRGDNWQVQVCRNGVRKSGTFPTKTQAKVWAARIEIEIEEGLFSSASSKTFSDALERYAAEIMPDKKGSYQEKYVIAGFLNLPFAKFKLGELTTPLIAQWRDDRALKVAANTVARELALMSAVLTIAKKEWQWITVNPVSDVRRPKLPKHRERIFSDDEVLRISEILEPEPLVRLAFLLALETCMRRGEILGLTWDNIFLDRRYLTLPDTKNGDARNIPLSAKAVEILEGRKGNLKPFEMQKDKFWRIFNDALERLSIDDARFHDTRHTAITRLARVPGMDVLTLAKITGHKDINELLTYFNEHAASIALRL